MPFISGSLTSEIRRSNSSFDTFLIASSPLSTVTMLNPSAPRILLQLSVTTGSSSRTRIFPLLSMTALLIMLHARYDERQCSPLLVSYPEDVRDRCDQRVGSKGLFDVIESPKLDRPYCSLNGLISRHDNDVRRGPLLL